MNFKEMDNDLKFDCWDLSYAFNNIQAQYENKQSLYYHD